jgi:signal transduction histidine kinase
MGNGLLRGCPDSGYSYQTVKAKAAALLRAYCYGQGLWLQVQGGIMKKRSISTKLFIIISLFFILLITVIMILHTTFFDSYYKWSKLRGLEKEVHTWRSEYVTNQDYSDSSLEQQLVRLVDAQLQPGLSAAVITRGPDGVFYTKLAGSMVIGKESAEAQPIAASTSEHKVTLLPSPIEKSATYHMITSIVDSWKQSPDQYQKMLKMNLTLSSVGNPEIDANLIYVMTVIPAAGENNAILIAVSSLEQISEASTVVKQLYLYSYLLAILLILILTFVFSRMISKPLIRLNNTASRMAQLDFSTAIVPGSNDEIGNLGRTMQYLSHKLKDTLGQLQSANDQLKQDIDKEKKLEKLRREFIAGVSHELKTPIGLIYGYAEGLRDGVAQGARRDEYLDVILQETHNMNKLVADMLDLSQLESGKFSLQPAPFNLIELMEAVVDTMAMQLSDGGIEIRSAYRMDSSTLAFGDRKRIDQVLRNLISNAIRHTPPGRMIELRIDQTSTGSRQQAAVSVFNQGEPIPEQALPHIWDTFYKVDSSRSRDLGGTGLGLSIVKNILSLHKLDYCAVNEADGVTFYFTIDLN